MVRCRVSHFRFLFFSLGSETKQNRNRFASFSLRFAKLIKLFLASFRFNFFASFRFNFLILLSFRFWETTNSPVVTSLSLTFPHHPSPSLTMPQHPSASLTMPHHPSPFLTIPRHPLQSVAISHHPSPLLTLPHHPSPSFTIPHDSSSYLTPHYPITIRFSRFLQKSSFFEKKSLMGPDTNKLLPQSGKMLQTDPQGSHIELLIQKA